MSVWILGSSGFNIAPIFVGLSQSGAGELEERLGKILGLQPGQIHIVPIPRDALRKMETIGSGLARAA